MHAEVLSCRRRADIEGDSGYDFFDADNFTNNIESQYNHIDHLHAKEKFWEHDNPNWFPHPGNKCDEMLNSYDKISKQTTCMDKSSSMDDQGLVRHSDFFRNLKMTYNPHYDEDVNLDFSVIRSTVSVYVRDKIVLNNIRWSEPLDLTFKCNAKKDPTLIWQYFASSSGFMRMYPAMKWPDEIYDKTYDHRTRSWYTESMTSPKDMIILLDRSGSMTGKRRIISRHIVHDILDTLADNDYVNVFTFANTTEPLITCFNDTLVQANEENLRLIRENLTQYVVKYHGRLDLAFEKAFEVLSENHWKRSGELCTQVIMVIAEGLDYFDQDLLKKLQELNTEDERGCRVRIFTYLLETEEFDAKVMLDIACFHMGYYVNISDVAEIREKVNMYTSVLSRSVNLSRDPNFQPIWSALYVDLADRRLTNWLWEKDEGLRQQNQFIKYARTRPKGSPSAFQYRSDDYDKYLAPKKYRYLTTVSLPVYDKRDGIATLLGVAAVDVPIDYMNKLTEPHKLGVNGYAFIITNNGYVLMHPDHRTNFKNILKPTFNRVDLTEVELSQNTTNPREFDKEILDLRLKIVNQMEGQQSIKVMTHMEDMKRIFFTTRSYYFTKIEPYSLVIALQKNYGHNMLRYNLDDSFNPYRIFQEHQSESWTIHPDWIYFDGMKNLTKNVQVDVKEMLKGHLRECDRLQVYKEKNSLRFFLLPGEDSYYDLLSIFLQDLKSTRWFEGSLLKSEAIRDQSYYTAFEKLYKSVIVAFISTHSGMTRWQYVTKDPDIKRDFSSTNSRSVDEIWYKRAVEENYENPNVTYTFAIPLVDEMDINNTEFNESQFVTVTHAIFIEEVKEHVIEKSPAAVVGYKMHYSAFKDLFESLNCETRLYFGIYHNENISCVVLDNHGYIMWSNDGTNIGRLILHHSKNLTQKLEDDQILEAVKVFDYQGICLPNATPQSCPSSGAENCRRTTHNDTIEYQKHAIQKTVPTPCDKEMRMYRYKYKNLFQTDDVTCRYIIQHIPRTNLALLVYDTDCDVDNLKEELKVSYPREKKYGETGKLHLPCFIETNNNYFKRPYIKCITANEQEKEFNRNRLYCGDNTKHIRGEL
ncbi:voltage-dependent calcium channel subunit alpha-2/delta-related [Holotrichia oblita]|uniref:Voltage-dependent calcium channel subunit alpha-2/delta-related n=1 Tax=Holotrichia oblita TaxID=644536 RepID=A0ACB9T8J3_HOLOL|nr:voltage-dependent calcium channel subunit alpha-2/delta-related [Holotrichia oblita]